MQYDVIIVGGAMAGATLALALSSKTNGKIKIAVLEKKSPKKHVQGGFDARCIALSDGSCRYFNEIILPQKCNLWQLLSPVAEPIHHIHVSDKGHFGIVKFDATEFHLNQLGAVIELSEVGDILLAAISKYSNIDYIAPVDVEQIHFTEHNVKIDIKNDRTLQAKLLVGADGNYSTVGNAAGISTEIVQQYQQTAIITNISTQKSHQNCAFERFTTEGPLALLPMKNNLMSLVWCVKDHSQLMNLNETDFLAILQQHFGWRVGKLQKCGQRFAYPLNLYRTQKHIAHRVALVGNAAQTLHPIAGQGFNLGIRDVMALADTISQQFLCQQDIGDYQTLQKYEQLRLADQQRIMSLTNSLVSIFANDLLPFQIGRNLGLMALSQLPLLKQYLAKPMLGWL
ncbi:2-octaprenyl-6-methoxyphenyl hydroxylase [Seminibacterium arietis]|uniref:2-octaprenyl-6-methoxyphenyl hydroxylase n=1 Tax=Seminibacterium arietis TaxID=1173502 RepID=A0ABW3I9E8_9PAST